MFLNSSGLKARVLLVYMYCDALSNIFGTFEIFEWKLLELKIFCLFYSVEQFNNLAEITSYFLAFS